MPPDTAGKDACRYRPMIGDCPKCALNPLASNAFRFFNQGTMSAKSKRLIAFLAAGIVLIEIAKSASQLK